MYIALILKGSSNDKTRRKRRLPVGWRNYKDMGITGAVTGRAAPVKCDVCKKIIQKRQLRKHKISCAATIERNKGKKFHCPICRTGMKDRRNLRRHFLIHLGIHLFTCKFPSCGRICYSARHLREHSETHDQDNRKEEGLKTDNSKPQPSALIEQPTGSIKKEVVKLENPTNFQLQSIHLFDEIVETESGPVHVNGEQLTPSEEEEHNKRHATTTSGFAVKRENDLVEDTLYKSQPAKYISPSERIRRHPMYQSMLLEQPEIEDLLGCKPNQRKDPLVDFQEKDFLPKTGKDGIKMWRNPRNPYKWLAECDVCGKTLSQQQINRHKASHETVVKNPRRRQTPEKPFACPLCPAGFQYRYNFQRHFITHLEMKPMFSCKFPNCQDKCVNARSLRRHIQKAHKNLGLSAKCYGTTSDFARPSKESRGIVEIITADPVYHRLLRERPEIQEMVEGGRRPYDIPRSEIFSCSHCSVSYTRYFKLAEHLKICQSKNHTTIKEEFSPAYQKGTRISGECDYQTEMKSELENHSETTSHRKQIQRKFKCRFHSCTAACSSDKALQKHIRVAHPTTNTHKCLKCSLFFSEKTALQNHMTVVHSATPRLLLAKHKRKHWKTEDVVPSKREICGDQLATRRSLLHHIKLLHTSTTSMKIGSGQTEGKQLSHEEEGESILGF